MKTITIILIVLFVIISIFFGVLLIRYMSGKEVAVTTDTIEAPVTTETETATETTDTGTAVETTGETFEPTDENIRKVEIYLDGNKEDGIFLGNATYGSKSDETAMMYGEDFSNFGFQLEFKDKEYQFKPGSIHILYIYTFIPACGWEQTRIESTVPGNPPVSDSIVMSIDSLEENQVITKDELKEVRISGWAADLSVADSTGIKKIEIYLDGPRGFGKKLGDAEMVLERTDVGNAYGNPNYNNSGYGFVFNAGDLKPGSRHKIYVYAISNSNTYTYLTRDIIIGEQPDEEKCALVDAEITFDTDGLKVSGWAFNKIFITEGVPRSLDIEYTFKKIVFVSNKSGNEDIWSMNLDGSELTQLTDNPDVDQYPAVSPDGKKIAYSSTINGVWQIVVMNWDGTDKKQITFGPYNHGFPTWSFDGRFIICEVNLEESWEIFVMESDGSNLRRLTTNPGVYDWHPAAHPFKYATLYESNYEIWKIDLNGKSNERISKPGMRYRVPKYSIDGQKIVFMGIGESGVSQIYTMDKNGENIVQLTAMPEGAGLPCFSPDNKLIVFGARVHNDEEIFLMNVDGSGQRQITDTPGADWGAVFMYQMD